VVSQLEGALKKQVAASFKGKLLKGTIRREVPSLNSLGDPVNGTPITASFEGIRESFSDASILAGIPETDVAILVLLGTTTIVPQQDDLIFIGKPFNKWHKTRRVMAIDPAGATCRLQAYEVPAPV
jgi:hypothetical protein